MTDVQWPFAYLGKAQINISEAHRGVTYLCPATKWTMDPLLTGVGDTRTGPYRRSQLRK